MHCDLCHRSYPLSQIVLRDRLNFCQACATGRAAECLGRLQGLAGKSRWSSAALIVTSFALGAGVAWIVAMVLPGRPPLLSDLNRPVMEDSRAAASAAPLNGPVAIPAPVVAEAKETSAPATKAPLIDRSRRIVEDAGRIHLLFVTRPGTDACMGLASQLFVTREAPSSNSAKLMTDVGSQMETSFEEGLRYVRKQSRDWEDQFSIRLSFEDKFTSKDGGSAGTGFTIAMLAASQNIELDPEVAVTGDVTIDGTVQPVGAVVEKLRGAIEGKCTVTLIPERNSRDAVDFALLHGPSRLWETQVISIATINDALAAARKERPENLKNAVDKFKALRARLPVQVTDNYLASPIVQAELKEILRLAPNHLSASILLQAAEKRLPSELSLNRSVEKILAASSLFVSDVINPKESKPRYAEDDKGMAIFPEREFNQCMGTLQRLTPLLDRRALELKDSCTAYASALRSAWNYQPPTPPPMWNMNPQAMAIVRHQQMIAQQTQSDLDQSRTRVMLALRKLDVDGSLVTELLKK